MNENLINRAINFVEKHIILNEDNKKEIIDGANKISISRNKIDSLILETKMSTIQNSAHLLVQKIMLEDYDGVIEMLNNNRDVIKLFDFIEKLNDLLIEYGKYRNLYNEDYPEIKKIKESLVLKEKDLLPLLTEIVNNKK